MHAQQDKIKQFIDQNVSSLPFGYGYLLLFPYQLSQKDSYTLPKICIFNSDSQLILDLAQEAFRFFKIQLGTYNLTNDHGVTVPFNKTILDLKRSQQKTNIDGMKLFLDSKQFDDFEDQNYLLQAISLNSKSQIPILLPDKNMLYIQKCDNEPLIKFQSKIINEVLKVYALKIAINDFQLYYSHNACQKLLQPASYSRLLPKEQIQLKFKTNTMLPKLQFQDSSMVVFKKQNGQSITKNYEEIKGIEIKDILQNILSIATPLAFGLYLFDMYLKPCQKLSQIDGLFKNKGTQSRNVVAHVVKQYHIFYKELEKINSIKEFQLQKQIEIDLKDNNNFKHKEHCQNQIAKRAIEANSEYFKNQQSKIAPILIYTSSLKYKDGDGQGKVIYRGLNAFLRSQEFGLTNESDYNKWEYRFASVLISHLKQIKPVQKIVYRGVDSSLKHNIGDILNYKQFNSTSTCEEAAKQFAGNILYKIHCRTGKPIHDYSIYKNQCEVLLQPYTELMVKSHSKINNDRIGGVQIDFYELEQVPRKQLSKNKVVFVLWVDDKTIEGKQIWKEIHNFRNTAILVQLISTAELRLWLQTYMDALKSDDTQVVMITNMQRWEDGVDEPEAGVKAIKLVQEKLKDRCPIFVYIGYLPNTLQKLSKNKVSIGPNLKVSNVPMDILSFLEQKIGIE